MKKFLFSVLCLGLMACAGSGEHPANSVPPPAPKPLPIQPLPKPVPLTPVTTVVSGDRWSFEVPQAWQKIDLSEEIVKAAFANNDPKIVVVLTQEPFPSGIDDYANAAANQIVNEGGGHLVSARPVTINEQEYYMLTFTNGTAVSWIWLTAKDGFGYGLTCGGPAYESFNQETCNAIANSLKLITPVSQ